MPGKRKYYLDLQIHTARYSPCSTIPPERVIGTAKERGLDGIALTEHAQGWSAEEIAELKRNAGADGFPVLIGFEVRTMVEDQPTGDLIVFGVEAPPTEPCTIDQVCRSVHQQHGIVIAPHPYAGTQGIRDEIMSAAIDAVEVYNFRYRKPGMIRRTEEEWRRTGLTGIAGSDAHDLREIGRFCTEFEEPIQTEADLIEAILTGRCRPRRNGPPFRLSRLLGFK